MSKRTLNEAAEITFNIIRNVINTLGVPNEKIEVTVWLSEFPHIGLIDDSGKEKIFGLNKRLNFTSENLESLSVHKLFNGIEYGDFLSYVLEHTEDQNQFKLALCKLRLIAMAGNVPAANITGKFEVTNVCIVDDQVKATIKLNNRALLLNFIDGLTNKALVRRISGNRHLVLTEESIKKLDSFLKEEFDKKLVA